MRGALKLDGVHEVHVQPGKRDFVVVYDPKKVEVETMLAELKKKGEPAQLVAKR